MREPAGRDAPGPRGTVLAFDFGERYTGVAVGELETATAHSLDHIEARGAADRFAAIARLVGEWQPVLLVVGVPFSLDGTAHALTERAEKFARQLAARHALPVARVDERLTSADAEDSLGAIGAGGRAGKTRVHSVAAQIILRSYFDDPSSRLAPRR